jgi:ribosomal-protein-alanine N-acetyltransferase
MIGTLVIAKGSADDLDAVMTVMNEAFDPVYGEAWSRAQCFGILAMPGVDLLIARDNMGVAGFAMQRAIGEEAELLLIAVRPAWHRHGIGRALMKATMDCAQERGVATIFLEVRDGNMATALYAPMGFEMVGHRKAYYRGIGDQRYDALTMRYRIINN